MIKIKENKNRKIFKSKTIIPITLSTLLIISSCKHYNSSKTDELINEKDNSYSNSSSENVVDYSNVKTVEENYILNDIYNPNKEISDIDLTNLYLGLNEDYYNSFKEYVKKIKVSYPHEELFGIEQALQKYKEVNFDLNSHENAFGDTEEITASQLLNVVMENNEKYLQEHKSTLYKKFNKNELLPICENICKSFSYYSKNKLIDVKKVKCFLSDLKIFEKASPNNAYIIDNCLVINPKMINVLKIMNKNDETVFEKTEVHEIMHMFQSCCEDLKETNTYETNYGICYSWEDLKVNTLMFKWFLEASAEKNMVNYMSGNPLVYTYSIGYLESMSLSTILDNNVKVNQTENLCFSNKLELLFNQFNCNSYEDQKELIKMMYSIDIMQSETDDFFEAYTDKHKKELTKEEIEDLKNNIKANVCLTLTKYFYLNLSKQLESQKIGIQDVFFLITVFENDINSHIKYNQSKKFKYNREYLDKYIEIQDKFFESISKSNNYRLDNLLDIYNSYAINVEINKNITENYKLDWLNAEKQNYILDRQNKLKSLGTANIRNIYESMLKLAESKSKVK